MNEKVLGYILLITGIAVIFFAGFNVYMVFTKQMLPIQLFSFPSVGLDAAALLDAKAPPGGPKVEILPANVLNETSNIFAHMFLMGFMATLGHKIASLGTQLVRPIVVKVASKNSSILDPR